MWMAACGAYNGAVRTCGLGAKPHNLAKEQINQPLKTNDHPYVLALTPL